MLYVGFLHEKFLQLCRHLVQETHLNVLKQCSKVNFFKIGIQNLLNNSKKLIFLP